ncbi:MAG TPA: PhzF family phenazine biosynthesis protein [Candidatus Saccharimonadales bacterium]|nr:PhzF family phenazine biosynthesis protein [Candidatus Saccharimonadales bacterium]
MEYPMYQVDAFSAHRFHGNPAAVVLLPGWLADTTLQAVAAENNLAETAFVVPEGPGFHIRWFTPAVEIDLCGHATLASAFVLFTHGHATGDRVTFRSASGELAVEREGELLALDFPSRPAQEVGADPALTAALGKAPARVAKARDLLAVFATEADVRGLQPDFVALARLDALGVIVTAPGTDCDFVSRFFAPRAGIPEDPVTGSAHCTLVPYWSRRLGKTRLHARQVSPRGGELFCEDRGSRVRIAGRAVEYLKGTIVTD